MKKILLPILILSALASMAKAEATKEFYSDNGLYSGNPSGSAPMNIATFAGSVILADADYAGDPNPPEGRKVFRAQTLNNFYGGWAIINVDAPGSYTEVDRDYSDYANGHIRFMLKCNTNDLVMDVKYVNADGGQRIIRSALKSTNNQWKEIVIALGDFNPDFNLSRIIAPFIITSTRNVSAEWYVDHVRWTKPLRSLNPLTIYPISPQVKPGKHRQFTVEGRDDNNELVVVYSTYNFLFPTDSTVSPPPTVSTLAGILAAGNNSSSILGRVVADPGLIDFATQVQLRAPSMKLVTTNFTVNPNWQDSSLGILSETISGIQLGETNPNRDSDLLLFSESPCLPDDPGQVCPEISDDMNASPEGTKNMKTVLRGKTLVTQFQGWAVQYGRSDVPSQASDTFTMNLNDYYDGSLRFWFKGPNNSDLVNKLQVGIRSGNVPAGKEISKIKLSDYVTFDNQWHSVAIPMTIFAKGRPFADISRTKILISVAIAGVVGGDNTARTFYMDNVRWDTQMPGTLARIEVKPNMNPNALFVPFGFKRLFTATGFDASGAQVDISPSWDFVGGNLGCLNQVQGGPCLNQSVGPTTLLTASNGPTPVQAQIRATVGGISGTSLVNVGPVNFTGMFTVYSDLGVGGTIGVAAGPSTAVGTELGLKELSPGGVTGDALRFMRSTFTLANTPGKTDAFAVWFVEQATPRFMRDFENGYLQFFTSTTVNLEISIRSDNVTADANRAKVLLSEMGVPLDGTWQEVIIPLDLFKSREPLLDFTKIKTFFTIGATSAMVGTRTNWPFYVDNVTWLTTNPRNPQVEKVYKGLERKQDIELPNTGLLRSLESSPSAFTYDQALAALAFTYDNNKNNGKDRARRIFDVYLNKFNAGGWDGFYDAYHVTSLAPRDGNRTVGPNAWLLISLIHYRNVTGSTRYDAMDTALANWLRSFQSPADGGVTFGRPTDPNVVNIKSTEQNLDCYIAFRSYGHAFRAGLPYLSATTGVYNWLQNQAWNRTNQRFNIGTKGDGITPNTDKALDVYSLPPLALSSFSVVVPQAEEAFGNTHTCARTLQSVRGFDFSGGFNPSGETLVDKDAVWLEGTAQMVLAYLAVGNQAKATEYLDQLDRAVFSMTADDTAQALAYATNDGTAYSFRMNSNDAAVNSMAWYYFANKGFNPMQVFPLIQVRANNISDNQPSLLGRISWSNINPPNTRWARADQYLVLDAQPITSDPWGIQIYTDNKGLSADPGFVDPSLGTGDSDYNSHNLDSNPAGLLYVPPTGTTSGSVLPIAWSIKDTTAAVTAPISADPNDNILHGMPVDNLNSFQWLYMLDKNTPAIDLDGLNSDGIGTAWDDPTDGLPFTNGASISTVRTTTGIHTVQGDTFSPVLSPDYLYVEGNFTNAAAQTNYRTNSIVLEFFLE